MLETLKNLDHAVESLRTIIRAKGADYVYEQVDGGCRYTLPIEGFSFGYDDDGDRIDDGNLPPADQIVGSCVMGVLALSLDPAMAPLLFAADEEGGKAISEALYDEFGWDFNDDYAASDYAATDQVKVRELFASMQREQDQGASWGVAFHRAIMDLNACYGTNYNPDVNSDSIYKED